MEPTIFSSLKVNNEIELCEVSNMRCKERVERVLLQNRISYFVKWTKPGLFSRRRERCIFCINNNDFEVAESAIRSLGKDVEKQVEFLQNKADNNFF